MYQIFHGVTRKKNTKRRNYLKFLSTKNKKKTNKQEKQKKIFYVLQLTNVGVCGSGRGRILVVFFSCGGKESVGKPKRKNKIKRFKSKKQKRRGEKSSRKRK